MNTYEQHSTRKLIATILLIVVIAGSVVIADHYKSKTIASANQGSVTGTSGQTTITPVAPTATPAVTASATTAPSPVPTPAAASTSGYRDGTFSATSSYYVPHSNETINVSLTLQNGVISNAAIINSEGDDQSARYQQDFATVYKSYVVGKKISDLQIGVIAGASDTSQGFNDALSQIASKAKA